MSLSLWDDSFLVVAIVSGMIGRIPEFGVTELDFLAKDCVGVNS